MTELTYLEVQRECARNGLGARGTAQVLNKRLDEFNRGRKDEKIHIAEKDNLTLSPEKIPEAQQTSQAITNNEFDEAEVVADVKWQALKTKLEEIFKGRVTFYLNKEENTVNFSGGGYQAECITYTAPEKTILKIARNFARPTIMVPNKHGYYGMSIEDARNG